MNSELQMPVGIVVMYMDHNGFYCIKENLSWLTPGTSHPGRLPLSPSFKFEVDDISVHFRKQISKMKCAPSELGAIPNWKPIRIARHSEWELFRMAMSFWAPRVATYPSRVRRHFEWVSRMMATNMGAVMKGCLPVPRIIGRLSHFSFKSWNRYPSENLPISCQISFQIWRFAFLWPNALGGSF